MKEMRLRFNDSNTKQHLEDFAKDCLLSMNEVADLMIQAYFDPQARKRVQLLFDLREVKKIG